MEWSGPSPDEVLSSIPESVALTGEESLIRLGWFELGEFLRMWPSNKGLPYYFRNPRRSRTGIPVFIPTMTNTSAPVYRSAITLLMSYVRNKPVADQHMHLSTYFANAQKCIERGAIAELIYASYIVAGYSVIGGETIREAIHKVGMFAQGASILIDKESIQGEELWWIETLWQDLLLALYYIQHETVVRGGGSRASKDTFDRLERLFRNGTRFLPSDLDIADLPVSMPSTAVCVKLTSLAIYLQFYFDYCLFVGALSNRAASEETTRLKVQLCSILRSICQLVRHLPNIPDTIYESYRHSRGEIESGLSSSPTELSRQLENVVLRGMNSPRHPKIFDAAFMILYCFSRLFLDLLSSSSQDIPQRDISRSIIALCRLCRAVQSADLEPPTTVTLVLKRTLFWAGIFSRASRLQSSKFLISFRLIDLVGEWILHHLKVCVRSPPPWRNTSIVDEEDLVHQFFLQAEFCASYDDLWSLSIGEVSLFDYSLMLAPWFLTLVPVTFDVHADGSRSLRMR